MPPDQDTFIFVDGFYKFESQGDENSLLVQNGPVAVNEIPDAFILMTFDLTCCGMPSQVNQQNLRVILQIHHIPAPNLNRGPASYTLMRFPFTPLAVEFLHGGIFTPSSGAVEGPSFDVAPLDTVITIDITDLVVGDPIGDGQLFLQIVNNGPQQDSGDRFYSRESNNPPQLFIGL